MNSRRKFMAMSATAAVATLMPFTRAFAGKDDNYPSNIVYTKNQPGVWGKKAATHLPQVEVKGEDVTIRTLHPMTKEHYIVRHTLVDENGNVVGATTFSNTDKKAVSHFKLPSENRTKKYYATSFCNKHDFWVNEFKL